MKKLTAEQRVEIDSALVATPHQLFVVDEIMKLNINGQSSTLTLGFRAFGKLAPVCSFNCSTNFLIDLAEYINHELKENRQNILDSTKEIELKIKQFK